MPRILLTTSVARASPSMSSAMINSGLLALLTASSSGTRFLALEIFSSWIRTQALLQLDGLVVLVGDEVRREEAAVELHALDHVDGGLGLLAFFDR